MEQRKGPLCILLFSGKRKSGKDFFTDKLIEMCDPERFVIIKISAPIKSHFAENSNLNLKKLMGDGEYKEAYRKEMINWSEEMRLKDPGIFCRAAVEMYNAYTKQIWIVSDVRRKTDISWFKENFEGVVKTIRIEANDEVRKERGWNFVDGIDDAPSECNLDDYEHWNWKFENNGDIKKFDESLKEIFDYLESVV